MKALVLAEHDNSQLKEATLHAVTAALACTTDVDLLIAGKGCQAVADKAKTIAGVKRVLVVDDASQEHQLGENLAKLIVKLAGDYQFILAAATTCGRNVLPRAAALLDVAPISDIIGVDSADTFRRPIYAGSIIATVQSTDNIKVLTVRTTAFDPAALGSGNAAVESLTGVDDSGLSSFVKIELAKSERPELVSAKVIVSGGRGIGSAENFALLEPLADKLGAAIGASRAAVDAGFAPNDWQVGQTGKIVAPDLYVAVGISGAIQHLAGMKDSKVIVAINKDPEAPIFQVADYGLTADLFQAVPEMVKELNK